VDSRKLVKADGSWLPPRRPIARRHAQERGLSPAHRSIDSELAHPALDLAHASLGAGHTVEKQVHFLALLAMNVSLVV
jgi:hypothetical protein